MPRRAASPSMESGPSPGEFVGGMAHVHAGIVQHQIADIDEVPVEQQRPHGFGHVAAGLPARG